MNLAGAYLTIVKRALDGNIVNIFIRNRRHLRLLYRRDATFRMQNENGDIGLVA
jgi:hypothetical protein